MKNLLFFIAIIALSVACKKSSSIVTPIVTPLPNNYISVVINGDTIKGTAIGAGRFYLDIPGSSRLFFNNSTWFYTGSQGVISGSYDLSTGYYNSLGNFVQSYASYASPTDTFFTDATHTGYLDITNTGNVITGTFSFIAVDHTGNTINITNGVINKVSI